LTIDNVGLIWLSIQKKRG